MAKDKEHKDKKVKKEKKEKKVRTSELHGALGDPANTSTDIILTPTKKSQDDDDGDDLYESRLPAQAAFAKPLANKKLNKKVLKTIKKGTPSFFSLRVSPGSFSGKGITKRGEGSRQGFTKGRKGVRRRPSEVRRGKLTV